MRLTHEAQVMPSIGSVQLGRSGRVSVVILPGSIARPASGATAVGTLRSMADGARHRHPRRPWGPFHVAATERGVVAVGWLTTDDGLRGRRLAARVPAVESCRVRPTRAAPTTPAPAAPRPPPSPRSRRSSPAGRRRRDVAVRPRRSARLGPARARRGRGRAAGADGELRRDRPAGRRAAGGAGGRRGARPQPDRPADPVPPGHRGDGTLGGYGGDALGRVARPPRAQAGAARCAKASRSPARAG